jgi:hypothetical protein
MLTKHLNTLSLLLAASLPLAAACGGDSLGDSTDTDTDADDVEFDADPGGSEIDVPAGDISVDTSWTANNVYTLKGQVFVTDGATLSIEAGTLIKGDNGSALVIAAGSKIEATGTAAAPIVFTSSQTTAASGDWSGLVLLGRAPINVPGGEQGVEGFGKVVADKVVYGGDAPAHDCGTLNYVRIEYAGFELDTDNELNGLTLGGCGTGTDIDFVQVHRGLDDGIEVFGGTVDLRHVVVTQTDDDGIDWDFGWNGTVQFAIVQQGETHGNRGIEADNNEDNNDATPRSAPELWNLTLVGGGAAGVDQGGLHLRRGTAGLINNAIVTNFKTYAFNVDGASTETQWDGGDLTVANTYFYNDGAVGDLWPAAFDEDTFDEQAEADAIASNKLGVDPELTAPTSSSAPDFAPMAGSPVLTGCGTPPAGFDASATFCGAIGTDDWTAGWITSAP